MSEIKVNNEMIVSVIVPVRNEEKYIKKCIQSILNQDFPPDKLEIVFVDGMSSDNTRGIVNQYAETYSDKIHLLDNIYKTVPYAMNIGIENSTGKYIVRLDAHSEYDNDYITKCISSLEETKADNAGGLAITEGVGPLGSAFAKVLSSKFGVGNSGFRTNASSGYTDTVPFGTYRRETFEKYGMYDTRLTRNQDNELNYRIRKNGGKVYLNSNIKLTYYCRNTISGILGQGYANGKWNIITENLCPGTMSIRHFVPLLFLLSLLVLPVAMVFVPIIKWVFLFELGLYFLLSVFFSIKLSSSINQSTIMFVIFPAFHLSYGLGSLIALITASRWKHFKASDKKNLKRNGK